MSDVKSVDIRSLIDTYEFPCKLPGTGQELLIRPITTGQMKKILVYEDETDQYVIEDALDNLVKTCVVNEDFDIDNIYLQDRFYLLLEIRKVTKGSSYSFNFKCPKCNTENIKNFSLEELPVQPRKDGNTVIEISERLRFSVDFPTRADQKDAVSRIMKMNLTEREKAIEIVTATFANCIIGVDTPNGILTDIPFEDRVYLLDNITSDKFDLFKEWFNENDFGVKFELNVGCNHCNFNDKMKIPLTDFFV